jgi:hypothetical protein
MALDRDRRVLVLPLGDHVRIYLGREPRPLRPGSFGYAPPDAATRVTEVDSFGISGEVIEVPGETGTVVRYRFSILNDGPISVTITRIGLPAADQIGMAVTRFPVRVIPDVSARDDSGTLPPFEPWHPFTMEPGQEAAIEMEATNEGGCTPIETGMYWWTEEIRFSVFGIPRETSFEQNVEMRFVGVEGC